MNKSTAMKRIFTDHVSGYSLAKLEVATRRANFLKTFTSERKVPSLPGLVNLKREFKQDYDRTEQLDSVDDNEKLISKLGGSDAFNFFSQYTDLTSPTNLIIEENEKLSSHSELVSTNSVVLLEKINNFRLINKSIEEVNENLPQDGLLLGSFETFRAREKKRLFCNVPVLKYFCSAFDFIFNRVCPKLPYVKKAYFFITKGKNRLLSKAEALGRLVSCGFEIIDVEEINDVNYFVVKKVKEPAYDMNPSYGPLFKMRRVGRGGKIIGVYKFRTMHPYSEYLQDYVLKLNGYGSNGKPANDFRLVPWGKFLRKYWLDELPQLINLVKGELKLVGSRPVSLTYFNSIPKEIQELRLQQKPGCIPPYVALDRLSSVESVLQAEKEYLLEKLKNPYTTDTKYFFKAIFNIVVKRKRSA